jgi:DNA (cytosine-5)-methyltransferase 1
MEYVEEHGQEFDAIHASPPCQPYSRIRKLTISQDRARGYPELIETTRSVLRGLGKPYVIESVEGAPLLTPIVLCGSAFGLGVQRHRLFECSFGLLYPICNHRVWKIPRPPLHRRHGTSRVVGCYGHGRGKGDNVALWREAIGIDWMTRVELSQAIPPAYTEFIGKHLIQCYGRDLS